VNGGFETLIYTDCVPGQGLSGTAGLQFQAQSAGADGEAMALAQQCLLYEPPVEWMHERRPVSDYPPSLAYTRDGDLAITAAGRYLGREANGSREGNQLTHCVVTREPEATFELIRPAQLFGAPFWVTEPWPTSACPPVAQGWSPGPYTAESLQQFVREARRGPDCLVALMSSLERLDEPQARRVLFVADRPEEVVQWIGAATLLLPRDRALRIGFKVFSTNPAYAPQPVLAVHPDWAGSAASVDRDEGYVVIDLVADRWSEVTPTPGSHDWVERFLDADVYDVLDAVEIAAGSGLADSAARALAWAATARCSVPQEDIGAVIDWLRDGSGHLRDAYAETVTDVLIQASPQWPPDMFRRLDAAAVGGFLGDRSAQVRLALIEREAAAAARTREVDPAPAPSMPASSWTELDSVTARRHVLGAARADSGPSIDAALRLAHRFDVPVTKADLGSLWDVLIGDWAAHPERPYDASRWPCGSELQDALRDVLIMQARHDPHRCARIADTWWRQLLPWIVANTDARPEGLDADVIGAAMNHQSDPADRHALASIVLRRAAASADAASAVAWATAVLWGRRPADLESIALLVELAPAGTSVGRRVFDELVRGLSSWSFSAEEFALAKRVHDRGLADLGPRVRKALEADRDVADFVANLPSDRKAALRVGRAAADAPLPVRALHADAILAAIPSLDRLRVETDLTWLWWTLLIVPEDRRQRYVSRWADTKFRSEDAVLALCLWAAHDDLSNRRMDTRTRRLLLEAARRWADGARTRQREEALAQLRGLGADYLALWKEIDPAAGPQPKGRFPRVWRG
jgi:hypothetical protein